MRTLALACTLALSSPLDSEPIEPDEPPVIKIPVPAPKPPEPPPPPDPPPQPPRGRPAAR